LPARLLAFGLAASVLLILAGCPDPTKDDGGEVALAGTVSIDGEAKVDEVLTANTGKLEGEGETFTYQWKISDRKEGVYKDIIGATRRTYTLGKDDVTKYIKVTVTREGYTGDKTSEATGPVLAEDEQTPNLSGTVSIDGEAKVGEDLTANIEKLVGTGTAGYVWLRCESADATETGTPIPNATNEKYTLVGDDKDKYIKVTVTRAGNPGSITSAATGQVVAADPVEDPQLTGSVSITGDPTAGKALTANASLEGNGAITYEWTSSATQTGGYTPITGAGNSETYTLKGSDVGKYIQVTVSREGYKGTQTSNATDQVKGSVGIDGDPIAGEVLTADTDNFGGTGTFTYKWESKAENGTFSEIGGATNQKYTLVAGDVDKYIQVKVTLDKEGDNDPVLTSEIVGPVKGSVKITVADNKTEVGKLLTADITNLGGSGDVTYEWWRCDNADAQGTKIEGAASNTYTLAEADVGKYIKV
jgi:hypothetical protein